MMKRDRGMMVIGALVLCTVLFASGTASAATLYVGGKGEFKSIQKAVDGAADGDVIIVRPGTYRENVDVNGKAITLQSTDPLDPAVVDSTVIDARNGYYAVHLLDVGAAGAEVRGFTITNATYGIYAFNSALVTIADCVVIDNSWDGILISGTSYSVSVVISNCIVTGNGESGIQSRGTAEITGCTITGNGHAGISHIGSSGSFTMDACTVSGNDHGGVRVLTDLATITDCVVSDNNSLAVSTVGGGMDITAYNTLSIIRNCVVTGNTVGTEQPGQGGGIYLDGPIRLENSLVTGNTAHEGGGIAVNRMGAEIYNCTVTGNSAANRGGGIFIWEPFPTELPVKVKNTIFYGNSTSAPPDEIFIFDYTEPCPTCIQITYNDVEGGYAGAGNIDADPVFAGTGDYHLGAGSPCISAGADLTAEGVIDDFDGTPRPQGPAFDIGAYEYVECADVDGDGWSTCGGDCDDTDFFINPEAAEVCEDMVDNDCDGLIDGDDPDCQCVPSQEICNDGADNDCDGKVDCDDKKDCNKDPAC